MKRMFYRLLLLLFVGITAFQDVHATHNMGVDIFYQCIGPCSYRIYHRSYYDCTGGATSGYIPITAFNLPTAAFAGLGALTFTGVGAGCTAPTAISAWTFESWEEVTPLCPQAKNPPPGTSSATGCDGTNPNPPINGVGELVYYRDYNFCSVTCTKYKITWSNCCRNSTIDSGAADETIFSDSTFIDLSIQPCNSSPRFEDVQGNPIPPIAYICAGQPFTFNQGAIDPDGDSLSYELGPCYQGANFPVSYNSGYSPKQPLGPSWDVQINPLTGDISFTPNPTGNEVTAVMCLRVIEWRNGVRIGQITRDMQITAIPGCTSPSPTTGGIQNVEIGPDKVPAFPLSFNEVRTCPGTEICFNIPTLSQDTTYNYTLSWNQAIPGASFTDANNPTITNSIVGKTPLGQFCWTPGPLDVGANFFVVSLKDDACPVPGFNQFTIIIYVEDVLAASTTLADPVGCNEVQLTVLPYSTIPSLYNKIFPVTSWNGNGNLNLNPNLQDSSLSHLYPAPGSYFYNLVLEDTFGCKTTIPGVATLTTGVTANAGSDLTLCSNYNSVLGTPGLPGQTYKWIPGLALDDSTKAQPLFTFPNTGLVQSTINYVVEVTDGICITYDYLTANVNPTLQTNIFPNNPTICAGGQVTLTAQGNLAGGNTYLWSNGVTTNTNTVAPTQTTTYSVVTYNGGCASDVKLVTVNVVKGPKAQIAGDLTLCPGDATTLTGAGAATYTWGPSTFTGPTVSIPNVNQTTPVYVVGFNANGCAGDTTFATIVMNSKPVATFTAPPVCEGTAVTFSNQSAIGSGNIVQWAWDFGDGGTSIQPSPTHNFVVPTSYPVQLVITSDKGCKDTLVQAVTVRPVPNANFNYTNPCEGAASTFSDASSIALGGNIVGHQWSFIDGTGSTAIGTTASYTFPSYGFYNVRLEVASDFGCTDAYVQTVFVNPNPIADFDIVSACKDSVVLASTASTVPGVFDLITAHAWNFGDFGSPFNTSSDLRPSHIYNDAGVYIVTLEVTSDKGCTGVVQKPVRVYPDPEADFVVDLRCENERTIFTNRTVTDPLTPLEYSWWDYDNGFVSTGTDGVQSYISRGKAGTYDVRLAVRTSAGCVDTITKQVNIHPQPIALFNPAAVCIGDTTLFLSKSSVTFGSIIDYAWNFGDGIGIGGGDTTKYAYREPGTYTATLTVVSDSGCVGTRDKEVVVHELPRVFTFVDDTTCFGSGAVLRVTSSADNTMNWYYSDTDPTPFHRGFSYVTPPVVFPITYYVEPKSPEGCINQRTPVTAYVFGDEELTLLSSVDEIEMPFAVVDFGTSSTIALKSWSWNFGDGNKSDVSDPTYEYQYPGIYEVVVVTEDINGCEMTATKVIEVKKIVGVSLPSAFTPNGDGFNDTYKIGYNKLTTFQIQIFNRWGQLVFESNNPDFEWDGSSLDGGKAQEGVFVYVVKATDFDGLEINESRTITLLR
ncbi:MAG: PKD domain-containing protein [Bacteroidia bacterium]|nr:PKD domain-containing protein [Bacteroidia bacterium]